MLLLMDVRSTLLIYLFILLKSLQIQSSSPYILRLNVWTVRAVLFGLYRSVFLLRPKVRFLPDGFHFSA